MELYSNVLFFSSQFDCHHYEQKIRNLEYENQELRTEVNEYVESIHIIFCFLECTIETRCRKLRTTRTSDC